MCLSKIEFPPNGKRCGKLEHMSEQEIKEHRDNTNARRRELYKENKLKKLMKEVDVTENSKTLSKPRELTDVENQFFAELKGFKDQVKKEDLEILRNMIQTNDSKLSQGEVLYAMSASEETLNSVYVLRLKDDGRGYYKPFEEDEDLSTIENYGVRPSQMMSNEVAAYRFSQALGGNFNGLVPETDIREAEGTVGTIQREVKKAYSVEDIEHGDQFDQDHLKAAAIFDYVSGSLDRHLDNFIIDENMKMNLIDNGLSFPDYDEEAGIMVHASEISDLAFFTEYHREISDDDIAPLVKFLDSPDSLGMDKYLTPKALQGVKLRAQYVVDYRTIEDYFGDEEN